MNNFKIQFKEHYSVVAYGNFFSLFRSLCCCLSMTVILNKSDSWCYNLRHDEQDWEALAL